MTAGPNTSGKRKTSPLLGLIKLLVILAGFVATTLCLMSVIGMLTHILWVRLAGAVVTAIVVPAVIADRLLPETGPKPRGLVGTVFAITWLAFALVFMLAVRERTKPLLVAEGDRLIADGWDGVATVTHLLAGGRPSVPTPDSSLAAASATTNEGPSASARPVPTAVPSAVAATKPTATGAPTDAKAMATVKPNSRAIARPSAVAAADLPPHPPRGSTRKGCTYPKGPYGIAQGEVLPPTLRWEGFAPGSNKPITVESRDLFDCDGKGGINAVVIDTSQYG